MGAGPKAPRSDGKWQSGKDKVIYSAAVTACEGARLYLYWANAVGGKKVVIGCTGNYVGVGTLIGFLDSARMVLSVVRTDVFS